MKKINLLHAFQIEPGSNSAKQVLGETAVYEIKVAQSLSDQWVDWFDGLDLTHDDQGNTLIRGAMIDQAALHGVLAKIRDLNLILISVMRK